MARHELCLDNNFSSKHRIGRARFHLITDKCAVRSWYFVWFGYLNILRDYIGTVTKPHAHHAATWASSFGQLRAREETARLIYQIDVSMETMEADENEKYRFGS